MVRRCRRGLAVFFDVFRGFASCVDAHHLTDRARVKNAICGICLMDRVNRVDRLAYVASLHGLVPNLHWRQQQ